MTLTPEEARWRKRLHKTLKAMPEGLVVHVSEMGTVSLYRWTEDTHNATEEAPEGLPGVFRIYPYHETHSVNL